MNQGRFSLENHPIIEPSPDFHQVGYEIATEIRWDNTIETTYSNYSISGWWVYAAFCYVYTGMPVSLPTYSPSPVPVNP